jgi:zinc transport system substrate-binding protein
VKRITVAAAAVLLAGCGAGETTDAPDGQVSAVVSHYPVQFLVEQVGGDLVSVESLTAPGAEPHDVELSPQQVGAVQDAATVFYIEGFQPAIDDVVPEARGTVVNVAEGLPLREADHETHGEEGDAHGEEGDGHGEGGYDPHVWLDPVLMEQMAGTVADSLANADPDNERAYRENAKALVDDLAALDDEWKQGTQDCEIRTMVVSHEAFGYLTDRYGFQQKGIAGLSPETEPSGQALAELARFVEDNGVTTVYTETLADPAVAETVAAEAGAQTAVLDPLEGPPAEGDYLSAMKSNLETVAAGQSCS